MPPLPLPPPAPARTLPYELIKEIFLRLPPDEPEWLVRASLASKVWLGRLTAPRFQGRYKENIADSTILMGMEDGSLGFARMDGLTLNLWSRQMGSNGVEWTECRVIDLKELLPDPEKKLRLIGSVEGRDMIFVTTKLGIYKINLNSMEWKKIWKREHVLTLIPYMSFYYPKERANLCDAAH
ncbi:unnamed protein product [Alopecurus aequalis]